MTITDYVIIIIEIIGTISFAASGAMLAIKKKMDVFGVCVLGCVTAVGGGMIRDIILGLVPSALTAPMYTITAAVTSLILFFILFWKKDLMHSKYYPMYDRFIAIADAIGLGVFTVLGITVGISNGYQGSKFLLVFLGMITGVGGGLLRDVIAQEPPYILNKHIYAVASIIGAVTYILLYKFTTPTVSLILAPVVVVIIRLLAAHFRWDLPKVDIGEGE